jgi:hypothetical protein
MKLKFELKPGQKFLSVKKLAMLEETIGWLSNSTMDMKEAADNGMYVFVEEDGTISKNNYEILRAISSIAVANHYKAQVINLIKK